MACQFWFLLLINIVHIRFQTVAEKNYSCCDPLIILTGKLIAFQHQLAELELETSATARLLWKIDELNATVQILETENKEQKKANKELYTTCQTFGKELKGAKTAIKQLNATVQTFGTELEEAKITKEEFNTAVRTLGTGVEKAKVDYEELNKTVANLVRNKELFLNTTIQNCFSSSCQERNATHVSFSARLGHHKKFTSQETLVFKTILNNDGDAYNANTGIFTAPVYGKYWFSISIAVWYPACADVWIMKNNDYTVVAYPDRRRYSNNNHETATVSTVMDLKSGDTVYCRWKNGTTSTLYSVYRTNSNTFSGTLLAEY